MTLIISNDDVAAVLTMKDTIAVLEKAYADLVAKEAVCRPRIDMQIPTSDPHKVYQWGTMEGGSAGGYFAIRMKSDVIAEQSYNGVRTQEKYCTRPGLFCGLILLTSVETGEPLAFINDGHLQHMRVGADGGIGVKYMAKPDAKTVGMLGSGGMIVLDDSVDMVYQVMRLARFFAGESCGKCYPCQLGTQQQYEIMQRLAAGKTLGGDQERLSDIGWTMTDASLCGLGQTAAWAVQSAMKLWPEMFA